MDQTDEDPDLSVKMYDESNLSYSDHSFDKDGEISSDFSEDGNISSSLRTVPASTKSMNVPQSSSGASHLISLFPQSAPAPAPAPDGAKRILTDGEVPPKPFQRPTHHRQNTERISNSGTKRDARSISDKEDYYNESKDEMSNLLTSNDESKKNYYGTRSAVPKKLSIYSSFFAPISGHSQDEKKEEVRIVKESYFSKFEISWASIIPTIAGSAVSALFHIVFCLAQASAIHRPYSLIPVMGVCVRMAAVGPLVAGVMFIYNLGEGFAAVCPTLDIFPAPFFAQMAAVVDRCLVEAGLEEDDLMFLTTFGLLTTISLVLTGMLIIIGTKVKLANLGAFLPFPVMCGFFSSVGVLLWNLSFTIDTGESVWKVLSGGDREKMKYCMVHHLGSLLAGTFTFIVSKKYKKLMPLLAIMPIPIVYLGMAFTGTTLQDAQKHGWFWSEDDITVRVSWSNVDAIKWEPPMPFGVILGTYQGKVHFPALLEGFPIAISMALIFFIRCSLHAPALRKTSNNLLKWSDEEDKNDERQISSQFEGSGGEEDWFVEDACDLSDSNRKSTRALNSMNLSISDTFLIYGKILSVNGLAGGFACLPSVGSGVTLYKIGASGAFAQYGSLFLLAIFYLTQFTIVGFLPKMTFSALLFVTSIEMIETWFFSSYRKTIVKSEWVVTPIIVVATFLVGSLQSVALGLAISTFLVVGTLNRSGVVKFISNGLTVKSITERNAEDAAWLDQNGDLIQLLVLQSYIFFGNANSCLSYVNSMFDDPAEAIMKNLQFPLPPLPKYVIIDMTLVVGMDTSSVEVFGEIIQLCHKQMCRVFLTGCHKSLKEILSLGGVKPSTDSKSANSILSFPSDIESALCKAEDYLLKNVSHLEEKERRVSRIRKNSSACDGFQYALMKIDEQHDLDVSKTLPELGSHTTIIDLKAGESLLHNPDGTFKDQREFGLYFIEHGMMKVERDPSMATTRGSLRRRTHGSGSIYARANQSNVSLADLNCRTPTIGRESFFIKSAAGRESRTVRLARLKPGFVIGTLSSTSQIDICGDHIAITVCRLHHLGQSEINELEKRNPRLILELFKMMGYLSAQRQETTIDQLATLHQIMSSLAVSKPVDRLTMASVKNAVSRGNQGF